MKNKSIRVYADTSVFGGVFDAEFKRGSERFFELVTRGEIRLVVSALVEDELDKAPYNVKTFYDEMEDYAELVKQSPEATALQKAYIDAKILTLKCKRDALHIALASVADCAIIISWNFKHIVNYSKIPFYSAVNMALGYKPIAIHSPMEVMADEEEEI